MSVFYLFFIRRYREVRLNHTARESIKCLRRNEIVYSFARTVSTIHTHRQTVAHTHTDMRRVNSKKIVMINNSNNNNGQPQHQPSTRKETVNVIISYVYVTFRSCSETATTTKTLWKKNRNVANNLQYVCTFYYFSLISFVHEMTKLRIWFSLFKFSSIESIFIWISKFNTRIHAAATHSITDNTSRSRRRTLIGNEHTLISIRRLATAENVYIFIYNNKIRANNATK